MRALWIPAMLAVLTATPAGAGDGATVLVCDSVLAARRLDAAPSRPSEPGPDCRRVDARSVGPVERRALIGGVPYECQAVAGSPGCLWIVP